MMKMVRKNTVSKNKKSNDKNKLFTKVNIIYLFVFLCDIILVIFCAMRNKVHYVTILHKDIFVGKTKYLIFGRNYVNLIITIFFYLYVLFINKFFLKKKNSLGLMIGLFIGVFVLNIILFFIFSKKIY